MAFTPKTAPFSGKINAVTLGTGDKAIVIGGQNVMPFYTFDAAIEHAPKIGIEISDLATQWDAPALKEFYAGCTTMVDFAKKAETMPGADFLCLHFESADPNGANRSVADCVADAKAVAEATTMPIVVMGCKNIEKDAELFTKVSEALQGKNIIVFSKGPLPVSNTRTGAIGAPLCAAKGIYHCFNVKRSIIAKFLRFRADGKRHADKTHFIQGDKIAARVCNDSNPVHMVSSVVVENLLSVFEKPI